MRVLDIINQQLDQLDLTRIKHMPKIENKTKKGNTIPYESLVGRAPTVPIFDEKIQNQFDEAIAPISGAVRWKKWGMERVYGNRGTTILLTGEPGTGKTTAARFFAKRVSQGIIASSMADFGGGDPGDTERGINSIFDFGKSKDNCTLLFDECDAFLWDRAKAGPDSMWMLSVINTLLMRIESYGGLVFLATNFEVMLDKALKRRLTDTIHIPLPSGPIRKLLWKQKIPLEYPLQLNEDQETRLALPTLTGAEIENCIQTESRRAIRQGRHPKFDSLLQAAREMEISAGRKA
jgi:SpoVK/Ycf46/Vps4 family AAA+-type ATPase